jgi:hypothetical protein
MADLGNAFEKLKAYAFITYRGCYVERKPGAWVYAGKDYYTVEELNSAIDKACRALGNSLNKIKHNEHQEKDNNSEGH